MLACLFQLAAEARARMRNRLAGQPPSRDRLLSAVETPDADAPQAKICSRDTSDIDVTVRSEVNQDDDDDGRTVIRGTVHLCIGNIDFGNMSFDLEVNSPQSTVHCPLPHSPLPTARSLNFPRRLT